MNENRNISILLKIIIISFAIIGLVKEVISIPNPQQMFLFYTNITNTLVLISYIGFLYIILKNYKLSEKNKKIYYNWKYIITISIFIVMIIANFILLPLGNMMSDPFDLENLSLHIIVPIVTVIDWFLFDNVDYLDNKSILLTTIPFIIYSAIIYLLALFGNFTFMQGSKFPYMFMDYNLLGVPKVLLINLIMLVAILVIGKGFLKLGKYIK